MTYVEWCFAVFVSMTVADFIWAEYTKAVAAKTAIVAGLWAIGIITVGGFATISYVADHWLIIPAAIGAFCGTVISVSRK